LSIAGEKRRVAGDVQPEAFHRSERATGKFVRHIALPSEVDENTVQADYTHGLLTVTLPKTAQTKPKQIAVQVSEESAATLAEREGTIHGRENSCSP